MKFEIMNVARQVLILVGEVQCDPDNADQYKPEMWGLYDRLGDCGLPGLIITDLARHIRIWDSCDWRDIATKDVPAIMEYLFPPADSNPSANPPSL